MIQFNLLPDVKMAYLKTRRIKRVVSVVSLCLTGASVAIFVLMFLLVNFWQKKTLDDLDKDISTSVSKISGTQDLNKILTIQSQLDSLVTLHGQKPVTSRLFDYISKITPAQVELSSLNLDYAQSTISISGKAAKTANVNKIEAVNKYVDTLKFTTYKTSKDATVVPAFTKVVLSSFGSDDKGASFSISFVFDPAIFDSSQKTLTLEVPKIISTRSEQQKPLFDTKAGGAN